MLSQQGEKEGDAHVDKGDERRRRWTAHQQITHRQTAPSGDDSAVRPTCFPPAPNHSDNTLALWRPNGNLGRSRAIPTTDSSLVRRAIWTTPKAQKSSQHQKPTRPTFPHPSAQYRHRHRAFRRSYALKARETHRIDVTAHHRNLQDVRSKP
ncbi:hypothetical protein BD414DRAFT_492021 [Trametes punicea]|nr:hypothetical protein BD414DRAFT_492021 [Trametes punicea]